MIASLEQLAADAVRIGLSADEALDLMESSGLPLTYGARVQFRMANGRIAESAGAL